MQTTFATRFIIVLATISLLFTGAVFAAGSSISGHLTDSKTGDALPGGTVILAGTSLGASTDLSGAYTIGNVSPGSYTIRATYIGYEPTERKIQVKEGQDLVENLRMIAVGIQGKTVVVTAQAAGQNSAINQQLTSNKIVNVVSAAKIQELPDANAAESVGRLPGISLVRQGGEAAFVVIRGLAPQYNEVLIDGVQMPATDASDRGTNLSMISSSMLGGITVTKAITPDMDAAVIGGVVNFDLREAQNTDGVYKANFDAQGGYDNLQSSLGPYKFVASVENRFFDNRFGVFAEASVENVNLSSNDFGGSYYNQAPKLGVNNPVYLAGFNLNDVVRNRKRYGATVTMDYRIPEGKIDFMNFASTSNTLNDNYGESYYLDASPDYHSYSTTDSRNYLSVITNLLDIKKTFRFISVDAKLSHSYSENRDPNDLSVGFIQNGVLISSYRSANPETVPGLAQTNPSEAYLSSITNYADFGGNRVLTGSLDFLKHINFSDQVTGQLKFGGMYSYTARWYNYTQSDGVLNQGSGQNLRAAIVNAYPWMAQPPYNITTNGSQFLPITLFEDPSFSYGNFLNGQYKMGPATSISMLRNVLAICQKNGTLDSYSYNDWASTTYDYSGHEYESAGYAMYTLNIGQDITFLPGVRYQNLSTSYTAPRGIETNTSRLHYNHIDTTMDESHGYWLPMVHLIYRPTDWLQVHLAYTNTLTYPDYRAIVPWMDINTGAPPGVTWNNYALKPGQSANYDVVLSAYDNTIGLFSVDGFLKRITNLIFPVTQYIINPSSYPGVPSSYKGSPIYTYVNNQFPVNDWGIELDWQTHFWYLPGPLSGLVLSANYTHIFSGAKYLRATVKTVYYPSYKMTEVDSFYTDRLIDQPNDIMNLALGYDYKGFSIRVSMLYQSNVFAGENFWPELRSYTNAYLRWDLSAKQNLPVPGLQVYVDLNNLNGENDISIIRGSGFPTSVQDYGMTADIGLRLAL